MEPIKKIFVSLDMSEMDALLVRFASFIANSTSAEHVYFANVVRNFNIPADVKKEFPDLEKNAIQERVDKINEVVKKHFKCDKDIKVECLASPGQTGVVLNLANKYDADLFIVGQKKVLPGTGVLAQRLARRASCNLFIIPEGSEPGVKKILVPMDFSKYSKLAIDQAIEIARRNGPDVEIVCQNVYSVPAGYHYTGKTFDEFAEVMRKHAEDDYKKFIKKVNTHGVKISTVYSIDNNDNLASDIYDLADKIKPDAIIIGAKGRTATAAIFLGSLAEKLVNSKMSHPLLVVRPKGKNAGLIETLKEF